MPQINVVPKPPLAPTWRVYFQCGQRHGLYEIEDDIALTIAALWQSSGRDGRAFAALASTGSCDYEELSRNIAANYESSQEEDKMAFDMLSTWALSKIRLATTSREVVSV